MPTLTADQVIGKTLYAKTSVPIKAMPLDNAPVVQTIVPGGLVGIVFSYLTPKPGRSGLYWMFYDNNGTPYYAEHAKGRFDDKGLMLQIQNENPPPNPWIKAATSFGLTAIAAWAGLQLIKALIFKK